MNKEFEVILSGRIKSSVYKKILRSQVRVKGPSLHLLHYVSRADSSCTLGSKLRNRLSAIVMESDRTSRQSAR